MRSWVGCVKARDAPNQDQKHLSLPIVSPGSNQDHL